MKSKYLKKKRAARKRKRLLLVVALLLLVVAGVILVHFLFKKDKDEQVEQENNVVTLLDFENGEIQTPYVTFTYPESFEDYLLVVNRNLSPYIVEFYAVLPEKAEQRIFDICLGDDLEGSLGVVQTDSGKMQVSMTMYSFTPDSTWNEGEIDTVLAMQEAANDLIGGLPEFEEAEGSNAPALKETPEEDAVVNFIRIDTPYCELQYPAIWNDWLYTEQIEQDGVCRVEFFCNLEGHEPILMFTVLFGGDEGEQLGVVTNTDGVTVPVNILMDAPSDEGLQDEERDILYSMQEAVNLVIQQLPLQ